MNEPQALPFHLSGNYAPVSEEITAEDLEVIGRLPATLTGTYVRNGPNPRHGPTPMWFLGQGMLHGVRLEGGRARWYRNRWVDAPTTSNTHIVRHAGRTLALVETAAPVAIGAQLETLGAFDFDGALTRGMTAHPKTCPTTGELQFFAYALEAPHLSYYRADAAGALIQAEPLQVGSPTYMHDFAITERFVLFYDLPVLYHGWRAPRPIQWSPDYGARIGVLPRAGRASELRWFDIAPCFISHTVNACEDGEHIVLDVVRGLGLEAPTQLVRHTLDLRSGTAAERVLDPRHIEFPRIDDRRTGRPCRYAYALELRDVVNGAPTHSVPRKFDLATGQSTVHDLGPGRVGGELVFVPAAADAGEDEGYAIGFVYDRARDTSELIVLDAANFAAPALARVKLPVRVPFGIHGNWFADA
jgi:carotenoid cleavage dioxygenase-like enzyme